MTITRSDLPIVAARTRLAGELLAELGDTTWRRLEEWQTGANAANYDPDGRGGWRYDANGEPIPADPTGEAAVTTAGAGRLHDEFLQVLAEVDDVIARASTLIGAANPQRGMKPRKQDKDDVPDGWCRSCFAADGGHVPVAPRYAGLRLCRWCGDWRAAHGGKLPPRRLVQLHREDVRITPDLEAKVLATAKAEKKRRKARR